MEEGTPIETAGGGGLEDVYGGIDEAAKEGGVWVRLSVGEWLIRSEDSLEVRKYLQRRVSKHRGAIRREGQLPVEIRDAMECREVADVIVLGWRDVRLTKGGDPIPYSRERCFELVKKYDDLRAEILEAARLRETFRQIEVDEMEGNFEGSSEASSDTEDPSK